MDWIEELDELNGREAAAVAGRRWDELVEVQAARQMLVRQLPQPLPASARPALERGLRSSRATEQALVAVMAETKGTLERLRQGRRTVGAYTASPQAALDAKV
jgi:anti-sigma factor RsiW